VSRVCVHCLGGEDLVADDDAAGRVDRPTRERGHVVDRGGRMGLRGPQVEEDARETLQHRGQTPPRDPPASRAAEPHVTWTMAEIPQNP
jgi:hypothetical protein